MQVSFSTVFHSVCFFATEQKKGEGRGEINYDVKNQDCEAQVRQPSCDTQANDRERKQICECNMEGEEPPVGNTRVCF